MQYERFNNLYDVCDWLNKTKHDENWSYWGGQWIGFVAELLLRDRDEIDTETMRAIVLMGPANIKAVGICDEDDNSKPTTSKYRGPLIYQAHIFRTTINTSQGAMALVVNNYRNYLARLQ